MSRDGDAIRLGSFFPILPWEPGVGWAREPPTSGLAEASMAPTADFTATITVPAGLDVLTRRIQGVLTAREYVLMDYDVPLGLVDAAVAIGVGVLGRAVELQLMVAAGHFDDDDGAPVPWNEHGRRASRRGPPGGLH